jgi:hypothetical protein
LEGFLKPVVFGSLSAVVVVAVVVAVSAVVVVGLTYE